MSGLDLRIVTTSWDDGDRLDLKLAGLLGKYGIKATFYIPAANRRVPLSTLDVRHLSDSFEIGAHTLTHADLRFLSSFRLDREIHGSKAYLEKITGKPVTMFCYPKGLYTRWVKEAVRQAGFVAARTVRCGDFHFPADPFEWQVSLQASNGSPLSNVKTWVKMGISVKSLLDWETRARLLFDRFIEVGGIFHLWGHSWEIEQNGEWDKLERVLRRISGRKDVTYLSNGEIFARGRDGD